MEIMEIKELIVWLKAQGAIRIKVEGVEATFGIFEPIPTPVDTEETTGTPSAEDTLYWSA